MLEWAAREGKEVGGRTARYYCCACACWAEGGSGPRGAGPCARVSWADGAGEERRELGLALRGLSAGAKRSGPAGWVAGLPGGFGLGSSFLLFYF